MKRGREIDKWYPFYIDKWLFGSTRHELVIRPGWPERWPNLAPLVPPEILEQSFTDLRGIFADLMTLSKKDGGYIRANETTPYPLEQLAGTFFVPLEYLRLTIAICMHPDVAKIEERGPGIYYIKTTEVYGFTDRYKRMVAKQMQECSGKGEQASQKAEAILNENIKKEIITKWNQFAAKNGLVQIQNITPRSQRESCLKARIRGDMDFDELLKAIEKSPFLLGLAHKEEKEPFLATFDWILRPSNYTKIMEGNYFGRIGAGRSRTGERIRLTPEQAAEEAEIRKEYDKRTAALMKEKGYKTPEDIPLEEYATFADFKRSWLEKKRREGKP